MKWPFPLIWIVPLAAAIGLIYYLREAFIDRGPQITIDFVDANGLKTQDSAVFHRGVEIGRVESIDLSNDNRHAQVHVRLHREHANFAKKNTDFWIVKADFSGGSLNGLGTIVSGAYIEANPHPENAETGSEFIGFDKPPVSIGDGIRLFLHTTRLEHLEVDAPIRYKGIEVGAVQGVRLSEDASHVEVEVFIQREFAFLVRTTSEFWAISPADVKGGVFSGIQVKLGSIQSLLSGGVSFATPSDPIGQPAIDGAEFTLNADEKKEWKDWSPSLQRPTQSTTGPTDAGQVSHGSKKLSFHK